MPAPNFDHGSWNLAAPTYAQRVGRMGRRAADRLISLVHDHSPLSAEDSATIDIGTGTGGLTQSLATRFPNISVLAVDVSSGMLQELEAKNIPNISTKVLDAMEMSSHLEADSFSHTFSTFMLQFIPNPQKVIQETYRVLRPGGAIGVGIWAPKNGPIELWRDACQVLDPSYEPPPPFTEVAWRKPKDVEDALREVGFKDIRSEIFHMRFELEDTDGFMKF
ncbi:hypothetical protein MMC14_000070 [Varicellaria rhodocarpa]|nr:hypothetical protein [Varicellaria rhodocarpa]